jgi:hypothetical protein
LRGADMRNTERDGSIFDGSRTDTTIWADEDATALVESFTPRLPKLLSHPGTAEPSGRGSVEGSPPQPSASGALYKARRDYWRRARIAVLQS